MKKLVVIREQYLDGFLKYAIGTADQYFLLIVNEEKRLPSSLKLCLYTKNCAVLAISPEVILVSAKEYALFSSSILASLNCKVPIYYYGFNKEVLTTLIFRQKYKTESLLSEVTFSPAIKYKIIFYEWVWKLRQKIIKIRNKL